MGVRNCPCGISEATYLYILGIFLDSIRDKVLNFHSNISCIHTLVSLIVIRVVIQLYIYNKPYHFKDRQQEAEHGLRYLTLFCSYCMHINVLCME